MKDEEYYDELIGRRIGEALRNQSKKERLDLETLEEWAATRKREMNSKDHLSIEMLRTYRIYAEMAESKNRIDLLGWWDRGYLTEAEVEELIQYNHEVKDEILELTGC